MRLIWSLPGRPILRFHKQWSRLRFFFQDWGTGCQKYSGIGWIMSHFFFGGNIFITRQASWVFLRHLSSMTIFNFSFMRSAWLGIHLLKMIRMMISGAWSRLQRQEFVLLIFKYLRPSQVSLYGLIVFKFSNIYPTSVPFEHFVFTVFCLKYTFTLLEFFEWWHNNYTYIITFLAA